VIRDRIGALRGRSCPADRFHQHDRYFVLAHFRCVVLGTTVFSPFVAI
jgi:heme/copper-type cytochrome/quinol oxidase subunit 1